MIWGWDEDAEGDETDVWSSACYADLSEAQRAIAAYLREHPGMTSKSMIARELQIDRSTVSGTTTRTGRSYNGENEIEEKTG